MICVFSSIPNLESRLPCAFWHVRSELLIVPLLYQHQGATVFQTALHAWENQTSLVSAFFLKKICFLKPALKQSWVLCLIQTLGKAPRVSWKVTPGYLQPLERLNTLLGDWWVLLTLVRRWKRRNKVTQRIKRKSMSAPGLEFTLAWFLSPGTSSPMDPSFVSLWVRRGQGVSTRGKTSAILRARPCRKALPFNKLQSREVTWRWFILISSLYKWEKGHKNARTSKNARPAVTQ